jgi:hypothetical protein
MAPAGLPRRPAPEDQFAIRDLIGKPIIFSEYADWGDAELEFTDKRGGIRFVFDPRFIRAVK